MRNDPNGAAPARPAIDLAEYDFSEVPESELEACRYYEYLRESKVLTGWIKMFQATVKHELQNLPQPISEGARQRIDAGPYVAKYDVWGTGESGGMKDMHQSHVINLLAKHQECAEWPWLKLPQEVRKTLENFPKQAEGLMEALLSAKIPGLAIHLPGKVAGVGDSAFKEWAEKGYAKFASKEKLHLGDVFFLTGFIQIARSHSHATLLKAFAAWLVANHPTGADKPKPGRGRNVARDRLNALGALRVRYHCRTLNEAQELVAPLRSKPKGMSYSDRTAWNRACEKAIQEFQTLLQSPPGHRPIHFTEGWQK